MNNFVLYDPETMEVIAASVNGSMMVHKGVGVQLFNEGVMPILDRDQEGVLKYVPNSYVLMPGWNGGKT